VVLLGSDELKIIVMIGVLLCPVQAQVTSSNAERAWPSFWSAFKVAINAKDKELLCAISVVLVPLW
jgi:hypothetical protein